MTVEDEKAPSASPPSPPLTFPPPPPTGKLPLPPPPPWRLPEAAASSAASSVASLAGQAAPQTAVPKQPPYPPTAAQAAQAAVPQAAPQAAAPQTAVPHKAAPAYPPTTTVEAEGSAGGAHKPRVVPPPTRFLEAALPEAAASSAEEGAAGGAHVPRVVLPPNWPSWARLVFDPRAWKTTLEEHNVDEVAQKQVFLLAQYSDEGARRANAMIANLEAAHWHIRNPSAFMHASCRRVRRELEDRAVTHS